MYVWLMKEQFVVTHPDTVSEETERRLDRLLIDQHLSLLCFYGNIRRSEFFCVYTQFFVCIHTIFSDGVF